MGAIMLFYYVGLVSVVMMTNDRTKRGKIAFYGVWGFIGLAMVTGVLTYLFG